MIRRPSFGCIALVPLLDYRGPREQGALVRAFVDKAWRWRNEHLIKRPARAMRNVIRFGKAAQS